MKRIILSIIMILLIPQIAQADGILDCLGDIPDDVIQFQAVQGDSIWLGYAQGGFDLPMDTDGVKVVSRWYHRSDWGVTVYWFPSQAKNQYWFVYDNPEPYDIDGHWGIHPCGAFLVNWIVDLTGER